MGAVSTELRLVAFIIVIVVRPASMAINHQAALRLPLHAPDSSFTRLASSLITINRPL